VTDRIDVPGAGARPVYGRVRSDEREHGRGRCAGVCLAQLGLEGQPLRLGLGDPPADLLGVAASGQGSPISGLYTTTSIESLHYQLRKVLTARGHFPGDDAVIELLWLAIINIEDERATEHAACRDQADGKRGDQPARLIEGQRVMGWREALTELETAYPGRMR
jgi:hypothetical protein